MTCLMACYQVILARDVGNPSTRGCYDVSDLLKNPSCLGYQHPLSSDHVSLTKTIPKKVTIFSNCQIYRMRYPINTHVIYRNIRCIYGVDLFFRGTIAGVFPPFSL